MNTVLVSINIMLAALAAAVWMSPKACRWLSANLWARSEQLEKGRAAYAATVQKIIGEEA